MSEGIKIQMHAERTPNPNSIKWVLEKPLVESGTTAHFSSSPEASVSPLASKLWAIPGVAGVFLCENFITVTKQDEQEWTELSESVVEVIRQWVQSDLPALGQDFSPVQNHSHQSAVEDHIRQILETEIRPAVARDGGDVLFAGYQDGVVELFLRGSCAGCPSSSATLKQGIQARLQEEIPEIVDVIATSKPHP